MPMKAICQPLLWLLLLQYLPAVVKTGVVVADESVPRGMLDEMEDGDDNNNDNDKMTTADHGRRQIEWVRSNGGFVHECYDIRAVDPQDATSRYGVFASCDLARRELILEIPRDCLLSHDKEQGGGGICDTIASVAKEMLLGEESEYAPYVTYLNSQSYGQLPTTWSNEAKEVLLDILGVADGEEEDNYVDLLPPAYAVETGHDCDETNTTALERQAMMLVTQRSWDEYMIPVWDMVSHRNGHWTNVRERHSVHSVEYPVTVEAVRDIQKGEELFMSYSHCGDCSSRFYSYGTPDVLRDYGFVEMYPQKFVFRQGVTIGLDYKQTPADMSAAAAAAIGEEEPEIEVHWFSRMPYSDEIAFFQHHIERLRAMDMPSRPPPSTGSAIAAHEWNTIVAYHAALLLAMELMVEDVRRSNSTSNIADDAAPDNDDDDKELLDWMKRTRRWVRSKYGFVSSEIEIRPRNSSDPESLSSSSKLGVFARNDIMKGDLIFAVPVIDTTDPVEEFQRGDESACATIMSMVEERQLGYRGRYHAHFGFVTQLYTDQLLSSSSPLAPSLFSDAGKALLGQVLGSTLPPVADILPALQDFCPQATSGNEGDRVFAVASTLERQRGKGIVLPLIDLIERKRKKWANTVLHLTDESDAAMVRSSQLIEAGQEIFVSQPGDGGDTARLFRDHGRVESYPQTWIFPGAEETGCDAFGFELDYDSDSDDENKTLRLTWTTDWDGRTIAYATEQVQRLEQVAETALKVQPQDIPRAEWDLISEYHAALTAALKLVVETTNAAA